MWLQRSNADVMDFAADAFGRMAAGIFHAYRRASFTDQL